MTNTYKNIGNLKVSEILADFVNKELLEGTNLKPEKFWEGFDKVIHELEVNFKFPIFKAFRFS